MKHQKIAMIPQQLRKSGPYQSNCASTLFINAGTSNMAINNDLLLPGQFRVLGGAQGELDTSNYQIVFSGVGTNLAQLWSKVYID